MVPQLAEKYKNIKNWTYRLDEHGIQLANKLFECIYQPFSLLVPIKIRQKL